MSSSARRTAAPALPKAPTGIGGVDEITEGGLPRGRPTLVCGAAGCGKTLFAIEFLARGATQFGEPGVFLAFEETSEELAQNVRSLGFDLRRLEQQKKIVVDSVRIERSEIQETGEYDLEGLFLRLGHAIDSIGAKRVAIDTLEVLFGGLGNAAILRAEIKRLFRWLKDRGVTTVVTAERGEGQLTRQGLEEYVSDCVLVLDHRVTEQRSTRRLRIVKYRGSMHGTNEYPFLIGRDGISVLPVTSAGLDHETSDERISSGIPALDAMLGGGGYYRGSSVLVSGTAGTGKTTVAAHLAEATCARGERCLFFSFEESERQIARNMRVVGIDLDRWIESGRLVIQAARPTLQGLESHLVAMQHRIAELRPEVVIVDPLSNFTAAGSSSEVAAMLLRLVDHLKRERITALFTSLTSGGAALEGTTTGLSSLMDTWLLLRDIEAGGERNRGLYVLKSRGMAHSNQIREFLITDQGVQLCDVYVGPEGVLTGSLRAAQEAREKAAALIESQEAGRRERELARKRKALAAQAAALQAELAAIEDEARLLDEQENARERELGEDRRSMARRRGGAEPRARNGAAEPPGPSGDRGATARPPSDRVRARAAKRGGR